MQAHGLSLLIKDLLKHVGCVGIALEASIDISNFEGAHAWFRKLLQEKQKEVYGKIYQICSQVYTLTYRSWLKSRIVNTRACF